MSLVASASGAVVNYVGVLAPSTTFNRPTTLTSLSAVGTAVYFTIQAFTVDTSGGYTITETAVGYDPFLLEYTTTFTPGSPLLGLKNGDDDFDPDGTTGPLTSLNGSQIVATGGTAAGNFAATNVLTAGTTYVLVSTSYSNGAVGTFTGTIDGPGTATLVPEPGTWAMVGLGLLGSVVVRRVRRRTA